MADIANQHPTTVDYPSSSVPDETTAADINDVFDQIALTEETLCEQGYQEGFTRGQLATNPEGYHLGYHRGAEWAAELGYYSGLLCAYRTIAGDKSEKFQNTFHEVLRQIDTFPRHNDEETDIFAVINRIRADFKRVCSGLGINGKYPPDGHSLSF